MAAYFLGMAGIGFTLPYLPLYLDQLGLTDRTIGFVSTLAAVWPGWRNSPLASGPTESAGGSRSCWSRWWPSPLQPGSSERGPAG